MIICISCLTYCCYNEHKLPHGLQKYIFYNQNLGNFSKIPIANKQLGTCFSKQNLIERNNKWYEVNNTAYHETAGNFCGFSNFSCRRKNFMPNNLHYRYNA